jgi:uncharacterized membrane protein YtjA (UPF0391 family)
VTTILFAVALILALVEQFRARGTSLVAWAVVFLAIGLLYGNVTL